MGCTGDRQTIEDKMMVLKLERMEVQMAKDKEIQKLSIMDGKPIKTTNIPDYIAPELSDEKNSSEESESDENESEEDNKKKKKKEKRKKRKKEKRQKR